MILGYEEDDRVEVTSGLDRGDRVIVVGQDGLTDATPVQILAGPGAEERPARTAGAASGGGFEMTEERRAAMRERMRARGMTDEAIDERLAAMAAGGGPPGGRGRPGAGGGRPAPGGPPAAGARAAAAPVPGRGPPAMPVPPRGRGRDRAPSRASLPRPRKRSRVASAPWA